MRIPQTAKYFSKTGNAIKILQTELTELTTNSTAR